MENNPIELQVRDALAGEYYVYRDMVTSKNSTDNVRMLEKMIKTGYDGFKLFFHRADMPMPIDDPALDELFRLGERMEYTMLFHIGLPEALCEPRGPRAKEMWEKDRRQATKERRSNEKLYTQVERRLAKKSKPQSNDCTPVFYGRTVNASGQVYGKVSRYYGGACSRRKIVPKYFSTDTGNT